MNAKDRIESYLEYAAVARRRAEEATSDIVRQRYLAIASSWDILVRQEQEIQSWPHGPYPRAVR